MIDFKLYLFDKLAETLKQNVDDVPEFNSKNLYLDELMAAIKIVSEYEKHLEDSA